MPNHDPERLAHWRALIAEQVQSGLSIQTFCQQRTICKSDFHRWKSLIHALYSGTSPQHQTPSSDTRTSPVFLPVRVVPDTLVELTLTNGVQLKLPLSANVEQVARLVRAVTSC